MGRAVPPWVSAVREVVSHPDEGIACDLRLSLPGFELDVSLRLPARGVTVLWGPSGCGKTTVLRALAGLTRAQGRVALGEQVWQDDAAGRWLPTHRRALGYVFQDAHLFAHLDVRDNLLYGHSRRAKGALGTELAEAVTLMGIEHLLARRPAGLSGGERQRVAIARALLSAPQWLLMDEPLSALDAARKAEILPYLERLARRSGLPILYVTHALDEAARLADHMVLMQDGRVTAAGGLAEMLSRLDLPTTRLDEAGVVLDANVVAHEPEHGQTQLSVAGWPMWVARSGCDVGEAVRVRVAARDVSVALSLANDSSILHILPATVEAIRDDGVDAVMLQLRLQAHEQVHALTPGPLLLARVTRRSCERLALQVGRAVFAQVKGVALVA